MEVNIFKPGLEVVVHAGRSRLFTSKTILFYNATLSNVSRHYNCCSQNDTHRKNIYEHIFTYLNNLGMFPLLARFNEFAGTPMEAPHECSVTRASNYRVKLGNGVCINARSDKLVTCEWPILFPDTRPDLPRFSALYPNEANELIYEKLSILLKQ